MNRLQNWLKGLFGGRPSSAEPGHTPDTIDEEQAREGRREWLKEEERRRDKDDSEPRGYEPNP